VAIGDDLGLPEALHNVFGLLVVLGVDLGLPEALGDDFGLLNVVHGP
jgi:hypothetical protein